MHSPRSFAAAAHTHDVLILRAAAIAIQPPPHSTAAELARARIRLGLPSDLGGQGLRFATSHCHATFLAARLRALGYARALHPIFQAIDLIRDLSPSIAPLRVAHTRIATCRDAAAAIHARIAASDHTLDTYGVASPRFHPKGLPSADATAIPLDACEPDTVVPSPERFPCLRQIPSLEALAGLAPSRFKSSRRTFSAAINHLAWAALHDDCPARDAALLISQSQPTALAFLSANLADPTSRVGSALLRPALLYHLGLPQLTTDPSGPDRYGDVSLNSTNHTIPHNICRDAHFNVAVAAYGAANVELEPAHHDAYSPGKRPDLYLPLLNSILDVKVGRILKVGLPDAILNRATHTAFAATTDDFFALTLGRLQRGVKGDGPFDPVTGHGYVKAAPGEYTTLPNLRKHSLENTACDLARFRCHF